VNRLHRFSNDYLLPLLIGALVLRALIPVGFMPGSSAGTVLTASLCNAPATGSPGTEIIRIEGAEMPAGAGVMHCDYCLAPILATAFSLPAVQPAAAIAFELPAERRDAPILRFARDRAHAPRAPPLA
jgi:hypothetical protein